MVTWSGIDLVYIIWRAIRYNTIMNRTINMYILTFINVALLAYISVFMGPRYRI